MADTKQELAADLVWRYVEYLREQEGREALTRAELEQVLQLMETASAVPEALEPEASERCRAAVRARLEQVVHPAAVTPPTAPVAAPERRAARNWFTAPVPAWSLGLALTAIAVLSGLVGTVGTWHRAPAVTRYVKVPVDVDDVQPVEEREVHQLLHKMVRNELPPQQEKNLMWHMLVCPGCFDEYVSMKHQGQTAKHAAWTLAGR